MVKKFGIVGVGPTGGIMAAFLVNAGYDVVLIDTNESHMDVIKKNGLKITNLKEFHVKFPKESIFYSINDLQNKELDGLFIAVKASRLQAILPKIKENVKLNTTLISLQNGFDTEEYIAEFMGKENSIRMVVNYAGNLIEDGIIRMSFFSIIFYH